MAFRHFRIRRWRKEKYKKWGRFSVRVEVMAFRRFRRRWRNAVNEQRGRTSIKYLPTDICLNILERLPITSQMFSMKLVCKASNDLVRVRNSMRTLQYHDFHLNPYWLVIRFGNSSSTPSASRTEPFNNNQLYLIDNSRVLRKIILPRIKKRFKLGPILSSNGLLCLLYYKHTSTCLDYYRARLFNPLTGEHDFLPDPESPKVQESNHTILSDSHQFFGFGYDARTHKYKLVRIVRLMYKNVRTYNLQTTVFTLGNNACQISEIDNPFVCPDQSSDVGVGGAIHWLCENRISARCDPKSRIILAFDLFEEKFHHIPKPVCEISEFCKISLLEGCLAITCSFRETCRTHEVHIWLLKEYGVKESWTKEFVIRECFCPQLYPLLRLNNDKIVMSCGSKTLCCYDPERSWFINCADSAEFDQPIVAICHACTRASPFF